MGSTETFLAHSGLAFNWARVEDTMVLAHEKRFPQGLVWALLIFSKFSTGLGDLWLIFHTALLAEPFRTVRPEKLTIVPAAIRCARGQFMPGSGSSSATLTSPPSSSFWRGR